MKRYIGRRDSDVAISSLCHLLLVAVSGFSTCRIVSYKSHIGRDHVDDVLSDDLRHDLIVFQRIRGEASPIQEIELILEGKTAKDIMIDKEIKYIRGLHIYSP